MLLIIHFDNPPLHPDKSIGRLVTHDLRVGLKKACWQGREKVPFSSPLVSVISDTEPAKVIRPACACATHLPPLTRCLHPLKLPARVAVMMQIIIFSPPEAHWKVGKRKGEGRMFWSSRQCGIPSRNAAAAAAAEVVVAPISYLTAPTLTVIKWFPYRCCCSRRL